jgi:hypothetical protein
VRIRKVILDAHDRHKARNRSKQGLA